MEDEPRQRGLAHEQRDERAKGVVAVQFIVAIGAEDKERYRRESAGEKAEQIETGRVGPMEVFEDQDTRPRNGMGGESVAYLRVQPLVTRRGGGEKWGERGGRIAGSNGPELRQPFELGAVERRFDAIVAVADRDIRASGGGFATDGLHEGRLPDARIGTDQHEAAATREEFREVHA
jgi:hypothetical protein